LLEYLAILRKVSSRKLRELLSEKRTHDAAMDSLNPVPTTVTSKWLWPMSFSGSGGGVDGLDIWKQ
jgi:hypothetical protein